MKQDESQSTVDRHVRTEPIDLVKVIKLDPNISGGGEAKMLITEGHVRLNGEIETRKRKKIFHGDVVQYHHQSIRVVVNNQ